jgi:F-type H+-transporting ATPase subunit b
MATTTAHTEVPGGQKAPFPPFQTETFASQLLWLALTFAALYLLMARVALPRIAAIMEARQRRIEDDLNHAQRLREEADAALAAYEKALAEARGRAQAIAAQTREKLNAEAEHKRKALERELSSRLAEAEKAIAGTKQAAMANVHGIAVEAASAIIERLLGSPPAPTAVEKAVSDVLKR